jgi:flagellar assembly protein FliH
LSRAFLRGKEATHVEPFSSLLPSIAESSKVEVRGTKLGRSAGAVESAKIVARAEGHAEGVVQGREEGLELGRAEGFEEAVRREMDIRLPALEQFSNDLNQVSESVLTAVYDWFGQSEQFIASLAIAIATRIVARELTTTEDVSLSIVREALAEVTHAESARIRVNPFAVASLAEQKEALLGLSPSLKNIQISDDPSILGGCVIESAGGVIDATIETRISLILNEVREHYAAAQDAGEAPKKKRAKAKEDAEREAA